MKTYIICLGIIIFIYNLYVSKRSIHMLQQNMYNENNRYFKWIFKNLKETFRFDMISLISVFLAVIFNNIVFLILAFIFYIVSICYYRYLKKFEQNKKPLVITARVKRFITTLVLVNLIILFLTIFVNDYFLVILALISSFNFYLIGLINIINYPVEKIVFLYYKNKAKTKLREMDNLKIIGITGSYGKTSCKNILRDKNNVYFENKSYKTAAVLLERCEKLCETVFGIESEIYQSILEKILIAKQRIAKNRMEQYVWKNQVVKKLKN